MTRTREKPFASLVNDMALLVFEWSGARRARFAGLTAQGRPYCPGVGLLCNPIRVEGGVVWWGLDASGLAWYMWQPLPQGV